MSLSPVTLENPKAIESATSEHDLQVAKLTKALYPADRQEKFLELQAEVDRLLCQLQALQRVRV
ncbi:hypothetical protein [Chamaesiphon minutus]|uniref:Uncharacterized protein n=1 Tax=Chamaesiphon minutus (strain ATCC 27169 / PCC 6605) TaxID=1173020 RepID=K9UMH8_CHAP6|nr:hypothetical protein [Chamaesiphon minutus]AFY96035.1 hypothetical protein Cha6605_5139 [Chamaesiphon minutus PCC 6605]